MRKLAAVLLCLAMVFSAGCRKADQDSREKKTVQKSDAVEKDRTDPVEPEDSDVDKDSAGVPGSSSDAEASGVPGSSSDAETSGDPDDSATTGTQVTYPPPQAYPASPSAFDDDFEYYTDLEYLPVQVNRVTETFYAREVTEEDFYIHKNSLGEEQVRCRVPSVTYSYDLFEIEGDGYEDVQESLNAILEPYIQQALDDYNKEVDRLSGLDPSEYEEGVEKRITAYIQVYRADTQIISYSIDGDYYNYSLELGRNLTISDILKDKQNTEDFFLMDARSGIISYNRSSDEVDAELDEIREQYENDTLQFSMDYDTVTFHLRISHQYNLWFPDPPYLAVGNYPLFNMQWFCHTPKYYALGTIELFEPNIMWDFNGDGIDDFASLHKKDVAVDGKYPSMLTVGTKTLSLNINHSYGMFSFVVTDDGRYIYAGNCCVKVEDDGSLTLLREDSPEFCMLDDCQDPERFTVTEALYFFGLRSMNRDYTLMSNNGVPRPLTTYTCVDDCRLVSAVDLEAVLFDMDTRKDGSKVVIPSGSTYTLIEFDPNASTLLFRVMENGGAQEYYAKVKIVYDTYEDGKPKPGITLSGIPEKEVFP